MITAIRIPEERMRKLRRNKKWKDTLQRFFSVNVELNEEVRIDGEDPLQVIKVKEIIKAFGRGFDFDTALNLSDDEYYLEIIDVKDFAGKSRNRQIVLKGRVIGKEGKMKRLIEEYTNTKIAVYGKTVSIIGKWQNIRVAREAIEMLLSGAMHTTVQRFLERKRGEV